MCILLFVRQNVLFVYAFVQYACMRVNIPRARALARSLARALARALSRSLACSLSVVMGCTLGMCGAWRPHSLTMPPAFGMYRHSLPIFFGILAAAAPGTTARLQESANEKTKKKKNRHFPAMSLLRTLSVQRSHLRVRGHKWRNTLKWYGLGNTRKQ